ncbi:hypothetical protein MNB_ARC-1_32 [hydrothermal vent metagenome]|uniref:Peptidoglycan synthetase n=1 Tax=hydrothermal vent metagenome TaxID=652676 RepID=A0A3B1E5L6_9ZZZZ
MQISSVVDIVNGQLLNEPYISSIVQIHDSVKKIRVGDLFIVKNKNDITTAIQNGAFAILLDFDVEICDFEIAWIKVEDIVSSQIKLLRFMLSNKNIQTYYCDTISFELFNIYSSVNKNLILLSNDIDIDFKKLKNINNTNIILSDNRKYIKNIQPLHQNFEIDKHSIQNLVQNSLFYVTFLFNNKLYHKIKLTSIYIDHFLSVENFLGEKLDTNRLKLFNYFAPIFINSNCEIVEFGKSNKFILTNNKASLINNEIDFLKDNYGYANIEVIDNIIDDDKLFKLIKTTNFNALYIKGKHRESMMNILQKNTRMANILI